jgi:CDP-glycerol glycerophosphotransferase (TagB/SpsB family)
MDRANKAGDNAQALFEYTVKQDDNIRKIFSIEKKSEDFNQMKKIGKVIPWRSHKFLLYFLITDKFISSQADAFIINPFGRSQKYYNDIYNFDYIFLQHGIIQNDLSGWLNKLDKNIRLFVTSAKPEYRSIIDGDYLYSKNEVTLTGLPRYDKLENNPQKKILIMPTWRSFLTPKGNNLGVRGTIPNFTETIFYQFYNGLITNERLLKKVKDLGYKIKFFLHPAMISEAETFKDNKYVEVSKDICNYSKEFSEGSLLVTDYSSVAFDFAYLRKPIIYSQFDYKEAFSNHIYEKGYFDYKEDGFGPVCKDLDSTIDSIIKILESGCRLEKEYRDRIDRFFEYNDRNNCKRVYEKINSIQK